MTVAPYRPPSPAALLEARTRAFWFAAQAFRGRPLAALSLETATRALDGLPPEASPRLRAAADALLRTPRCRLAGFADPAPDGGDAA